LYSKIVFMKKLCIILIFSLIAFGCNNSKDEKKVTSTDSVTVKDIIENAVETDENKSNSMQSQERYGIKSAMVVTSTTLPNNMGKSVATMYFDDYGKISFTETVALINMKGVPASPKKFSIKQGELIYSWDEGKKTGTKMNLANLQDLNNINFEKLGEEMLKEMKITKGGNENFLGKSCVVVEMNSDKLGKGKILTWKNIPMRSDMTTMGMQIKSVVTELEENALIEPSKFVVPADIQFKEMNFNLE